LNITVDPTTNRINMAGFSYDAAGNLTHTPDGKTYAYDSENRTSQGNEGTYYYGANGRRLASVSSGTNGTWYFHGPGGIEVSLISAPSTAGCGQYYSGLQSGFCVQGSAQEKLYFAGRLVLQGDASNSTSPGGLATVTDRLGSVVQTDGNVASIMDYVYYPYGGVPSGLMPNQVTFATYEAAGTSLLYAQNRFYDSARGRFTTPDPSGGSMHLANPLSFNRYAYVMGDPINNSDPSGLDGVCGPGKTWMGEGCYDYGGSSAAFYGSYVSYAAGVTYNFINNAVSSLLRKGSGNTPSVSSTITYAGAPDPPLWGTNGGSGARILGNVGTTTAPLTNPLTYVALAGASATAALGTGAVVTATEALAAAVSTAAATGTAGAAGASYVFYSGPGAQEAAQAWSAVNNGVMIGMTGFGQAIENGTMSAEAASEAFANSASGAAQVFSNAPLTNFGNIWFNYELPALANNPNITSIIFNSVPKP